MFDMCHICQEIDKHTSKPRPKFLDQSNNREVHFWGCHYVVSHAHEPLSITHRILQEQLYYSQMHI